MPAALIKGTHRSRSRRNTALASSPTSARGLPPAFSRRSITSGEVMTLRSSVRKRLSSAAGVRAGAK
jgi:hypothetical protein